MSDQTQQTEQTENEELRDLDVPEKEAADAKGRPGRRVRGPAGRGPEEALGRCARPAALGRAGGVRWGFARPSVRSSATDVRTCATFE
jgi:hypothetical protein